MIYYGAPTYLRQETRQHAFLVFFLGEEKLVQSFRKATEILYDHDERQSHKIFFLLEES